MHLSIMLSLVYIYILWLLTVHRKEKGSTITPTSGSDKTKLEPPKALVLALPNAQPTNPLGSPGCGIDVP